MVFLDSITSSILSSIIYDLLKVGGKLTFHSVFGGFYGNRMSQNSNVYNDFLEKVNKEEDIIGKKKIVQDVLKDKNLYVEIFNQDLYNTNFAKRLDYIMCVMNKARIGGRKVNLEYLGEFLGFDSVNELKKYYKYEEEPTYVFCEKVADKLGIDAEWLKSGDIGERIFNPNLPRIYDAEQILFESDSKEFEFYFIIKNDVENREIIIVRRYNELKFEYYPCPIVFNSRVGATGARYLLSLYYFLKTINSNQNNEILNVHMVPEDIFYRILEGKEYCGIMEQYGPDNKITIFDDFLDVYHQYHYSEIYGDRYGEDFVRMQKIVRHKLDENCHY